MVQSGSLRKYAVKMQLRRRVKTADGAQKGFDIKLLTPRVHGTLQPHSTLTVTMTCRVVIVGAGPAGLLAAFHFYGARVPSSMKWTWWKEARATVLLDVAGLEKQRSWMIHLSTQHCLAA